MILELKLSTYFTFLDRDYEICEILTLQLTLTPIFPAGTKGTISMIRPHSEPFQTFVVLVISTSESHSITITFHH